MTRRRYPKPRQQPSKRDLDHPLAQAVRLLRGWLTAGPLTGRQLDQLAAQRGLSPSWSGQALSVLLNRREVDTTQSGRDTTYRLVPTHKRRSTPC